MLTPVKLEDLGGVPNFKKSCTLGPGSGLGSPKDLAGPGHLLYFLVATAGKSLKLQKMSENWLGKRGAEETYHRAKAHDLPRKVQSLLEMPHAEVSPHLGLHQNDHTIHGGGIFDRLISRQGQQVLFQCFLCCLWHIHLVLSHWLPDDLNYTGRQRNSNFLNHWSQGFADNRRLLDGRADIKRRERRSGSGNCALLRVGWGLNNNFGGKRDGVDHRRRGEEGQLDWLSCTGRRAVGGSHFLLTPARLDLLGRPNSLSNFGEARKEVRCERNNHPLIRVWAGKAE